MSSKNTTAEIMDDATNVETSIRLDKADVIAFLVERELELAKKDYDESVRRRSECQQKVDKLTGDWYRLVTDLGQQQTAKATKAIADSLRKSLGLTQEGDSVDVELHLDNLSDFCKGPNVRAKISVRQATRPGTHVQMQSFSWLFPVKLSAELNKFADEAQKAVAELGNAANCVERANRYYHSIKSNPKALERNLRAKLVGKVLADSGEKGKSLLQSFDDLRASGALNLLTTGKNKKGNDK